MPYRINSDPFFIECFRKEMEFTIFNSTEDTTCSQRAGIDTIKNFLVENQPDRTLRKLIHFNPFKGGHKRQSNAYLPHTCMVDLDFKGEDHQKLKDLLCEQQNETDFDKAFNKLATNIKNDPCCLYFDYSASHGKMKVYTKKDGTTEQYKAYGFKCLFNILSNKYGKEYSTYEPVNVDGMTSEERLYKSPALWLMKQNVKVLKEYLKDKYNIEGGYYDNHGDGIQQGIYSSWGKGFMLNPDAHIIWHDVKSPSKGYGKGHEVKLTNDELTNDNNKFSEEYFNWINDIRRKSKLGLPDYVDQLNVELDFWMKMEHRDNMLNMLFSFNFLDVKYLQQYYNIIKETYKGGSVNVSSFVKFVKSVTTVKGNWARPLRDIIKPRHIFRDEPHDLYKNNYDETLIINNWVSDKRTELYKIFDSHRTVVLKADAGTRKTTELMRYAAQMLNQGVYKKIGVIIPKNSLLEQQLSILKKDYPSLKIHENYNKKRYNYYDGDGLILSSTPKASNLVDCDLIIVDEVQNLVNYSQKIISVLPDKPRKILVSATPEKYLIGETDYYYVNLKTENARKKGITRFISKQNNKLLQQIIDPNRKQLIYFNNIVESEKVFSDGNFSGITFTFVNSPNRSSIDSQNVIIKQKLEKSHYVITSFLTDGLNFKNNHWDDLIIIENGGLGPDEVYQLVNRFRQLKNDLTVILISKPRPFRGGRIDFNSLKDISYYQNRLKVLKQIEMGLNRQSHLNENESLLSSNNFIKNERTHTYKLNRDSIKFEMYQKEFLDKYNSYQDVQDYGLEYYFVVNNVFKVEHETKRFNNNTVNYNLFMSYQTGITSVLGYITDSIYLNSVNHNLPLSVVTAIEDDFTYFQRLAKRCTELEMYGGDISKCGLAENNYKPYIQRLKKKLLGTKTNKAEIDLYDKLWHDRQDRFIEIVKNNGLVKQYKTTRSKYEYITADDCIGLFSGNTSLYKEFFNDKNEYDFNLTKTDLGIYLASMPRYVKRVKTRKTVFFRFK